MAEKKSIMLYLDAVEQWDMLSDEQAGKLIKALLRYGKNGERLETNDGMLSMAFSFMAAQLDRDGDKYEKKCLKNAENIRKRWNKNTTNVYDRIQMNTKHTDTDTDKDTDTDTHTDKDTDIIKKKEKASAIDKILSEYTQDEKLQNALRDFIKFRKAIKAPLTDKALTLCMSTLDKLSKNDTEKIAIIEQSIERGWKGLFPLKESNKLENTDSDIEQYKKVINQFLPL